MNLSPRLKAVACMVRGKTVSDIGTDHGKIPIYLIKNFLAEKVIASDINDGPVNSCRKNVALYGVSDKVECRKGSGLSVLTNGEAETIIIAGMGGELITNIIDAHKEIAQNAIEIILQPMNGIDKLRKYLYDNGFLIVDETLAKEENRIYTIIKIKTGKMILNDETDLIISPVLESKGGELFKAFIKKEKQKTEKILKGLSLGKEEDGERKKYLEKILKRINDYEVK